MSETQDTLIARLDASIEQLVAEGAAHLDSCPDHAEGAACDLCANCADIFGELDLLREARAALVRQQEEIANWQTWGIVEIAVRNPNVTSYMNHWEGRTLKAEAQLREAEARVRTAEATVQCYADEQAKLFAERKAAHAATDEALASQRAGREARRHERIPKG